MFSFRKKSTGKSPDEASNPVEVAPPIEKISLKDDDTPTKVMSKVATKRDDLPQEYQALVPDELSKDLAELAVLQEEIETLNEQSNGLLGLFADTELDEAGTEEENTTKNTSKKSTKKEEETKKATKKRSSKKAKEDEKTKKRSAKKKEAEDAKTKKRAAKEKKAEEKAKKQAAKEAKETEETTATNEKKDTDKESTKDSSSGFSLVKQIKQVMLQQKELLKKLAAMGNTPIFKPESFSRLMSALPVISAWQQNGAPMPPANTAPAQNTTATPTAATELTPSSTPPAQNAATITAAPATPSESEAEIRKDLGIKVAEEPKQPGEISAKEIAKLTKDVAEEGFLESTVDLNESTAMEDEIRAQIDVNDVFTDKRKLTKRELAKKEKMEREQEKAWKEEAARRAKEIEKRRKEAERLAKQEAKTGKKIELTAPKKKKIGKLQAFMLKLNYFGLGKMKDEFIENLGVMMDAGLPLLDALRTLELEAKKKPYKKLLAKIVVAVETGSPLWRAMQATHFFEGQQISMVKVGEEAGNLVENLRYLAEQSAKQRDLRAKVKTAMIYPIIVFVMLTLIIFGLGMFVLPNLIQIIVSLGVPMPFITRMIVMFTNMFQEHGFILMPSLAVTCIILVILHKYTSFKVFSQWLIMKIPGIGVLIRESILSQFGVTMGGLLQAGVPVTDAIESIANTTPIAKYQKFYFLLLRQIKLGDSFSTAFKKIKLTDKCFPGSMQQLIKTGEKSGSLTKIMMKISEIHEKKASDVAEKLPVILEPMLLLFIGSLVGTIALGVLAPIYSIVGNVGGA